MNRRGFLLGAGAAAAAASLPVKALALALEPVEGAVAVSAGTELTLAKMRATMAMLKAAKPRLIMDRMGTIYPLTMLAEDAPPLKFRRPPPFQPGDTNA